METRAKTKLKVESETTTTEQGPSKVTQMTQVQIKEMEKAVNNPLIIHKVVNSMDFLQLKVIRRVNKNWSCVASEIIKKKDLGQMCYDFFDYRRPCKLTTEFSELLFSTLSILSIEKNPTVLKYLFQRHAEKIKTLSIKSYDNRKSSNDVIFQLIRIVAPTLEHLKISNFNFKWPEDKDNLEFPCLKSIFCDSARIIHQILRVAPNLKRIDCQLDNNNEMLVEIGACGRLDLIKEANVYGLLGGSFDMKGLKLQKLEIGNYEGSENAKILEASKDSLRHLTLDDTFGSKSFIIPKLSNLNTLKMVHQRFILDVNNAPAIRRISLDETFSNVQVLDLTCIDSFYYQTWADALSPEYYSGNFPTVKKLKMGTLQEERLVSKLFPLCPNFTQLEIKCNIGNPNLARVFKMWPHLKELELTGLDVHPISQQFQMDSYLTGMSEKNCERLRSSNSEEKQENWQELVTGPSLRDLKELMRFTVRVKHGHFVPFSRVSGIYAFKMMPLLKVKLFAYLQTDEVGRFMEELGAFVNIECSKH